MAYCQFHVQSVFFQVALTVYKALVWYAGAPWSSGNPGDPRAPNVLILGGSGGTG